MIMTILKQTIRFHLDEKEHEIASVYAELYCKMVVQYIHKREQAIAALKDLAYEFYIYEHYRHSLKYYLEVKKQYGDSALNDHENSMKKWDIPMKPSWNTSACCVTTRFPLI